MTLGIGAACKVKEPPIKRAHSFIAKNLEGCWLWAGKTIPAGYGYFKINGKNLRAHRFFYEHYKGPIPDGLQLDHLCRVRHCVNPDHLEAVTPKENTRRSPIHCGSKAHCRHGHPFAEDNLYVYPDGRRRCKTCRNAGKRERRKRLKACL